MDIEFSCGQRRVAAQSREDLNFPILNDYGEDRFGLRFSRGRHSGGEWMHLMISEDRGVIWLDDRNPVMENAYHGPFLIQRRDESLIVIHYTMDSDDKMLPSGTWGEIYRLDGYNGMVDASRHAGRACLLYADWHVEQKTPEELLVMPHIDFQNVLE